MTFDPKRIVDLARPPHVLFGAGAAPTVGRWVKERGLSRPLIVADTFNAGRIDRLGLEGRAEVFSRIQAEPTVEDLAALVAAAEAFRPDVVIGFGGGSAMDLAKLAAVLPGSGQRFAEVVGAEKVARRRAALVQVPTTSGTGSEAGTRALVTDPATQNKLAVQSDWMLADLAVVDPDLTSSLPRAITAATGIDALAHCVEAFTSKRAHPTVDLYALEGIRLVGRWLPRAVADGGDRDARCGMALASLYGGFCLGPVNTTAGHAVSYPLGARFHIPHGAANALVFPHVLAFNASAVPERTAAVLAALGSDTHTDGPEVLAAAHRFCAALGCEMRLRTFGVPEDQLPVMASEAHAIRRLLDNNPRNMTPQDILDVYRAAF